MKIYLKNGDFKKSPSKFLKTENLFFAINIAKHPNALAIYINFTLPVSNLLNRPF